MRCMRWQCVSSLSHSWTRCQMFALKCGASCGALANSLTSCDHLLRRACGVTRAGLVKLYACQLIYLQDSPHAGTAPRDGKVIGACRPQSHPEQGASEVLRLSLPWAPPEQDKTLAEPLSS